MAIDLFRKSLLKKTALILGHPVHAVKKTDQIITLYLGLMQDFIYT